MEENSAKVFCAVCRFKLPREVKTNIEEYTLAFFEGSEKGKRIIENWITRQVFSPNIRVKEIQETRQTFNKMLISSDEPDDKRNNEYHKVLIAKNETSEEIK